MTLIQKINKAKITSIVITSILLIGAFSTPTTAFANAQQTSTTFGYDVNPVPEGTPVEMSGTVTATAITGHAGGPIDGGDVQIRQGTDVNHIPVSDCSLAINFDTIDTVQTNASGDYSFNFPTDGLGGQTLVFQARYAGEPNGNGVGHNIVQSQSTCLPLEITVAECEGDIQIAAKNSSADPDNGLFGYTIEVKACTDVENVKIQGGSNGWSTIQSFTESPDGLGTVDKMLKAKNTVYSWKISELEEGLPLSFEVVLTPNIQISCGQTVQLNGGWSVAYNLPGDNTKYKSGYTAPLTWTKECA